MFALIGQGSAPSHGHVLAIGIGMFAASAVLGVVLLRNARNVPV